MSSITISIPDERFEQLQQAAAKFGVSPEDLVRYSIEDLLTQPDDAFRQAVLKVLDKNSDLYQRLA